MDKAIIEKWILPHLTIGTRGFETTVPLTEIVECIFHRLKTGCQWRELPTKEFFTGKILCWNAVFYYYNNGASRAVEQRRLVAHDLDQYAGPKS